MSRHVVVVLEVADHASNDQVHEALCKILHEGYAFDDPELGLGAEWAIDVGPIADYVDRDTLTDDLIPE